MAKLQLSGERYAALGDPAAPITIVEFSDFGCPYCRVHASSVFKELKTQYIDTGKVYYVFKDFPIRELHPQARLAAEAAECAGAQGGYWPMHDQLFAEPSEWDGGSAETAEASFRRYAERIGLDRAAFEQCLASDQFTDEIQRDYDEARALGLTGTPAFVINGKLLSGARPIQQFSSVLDGELAQR
jgi:protein-disulfide isomerase